MNENDAAAVRKTISMPADLWRRIEDYQFQQRLKRDTEVIRQLLELGLEVVEKRQKGKA